jgi:hypothetical protein
MMRRVDNMATMNLGDFISQTIQEIVDGVIAAQEQVKGKGARVNPDGVSWSESGKFHYMGGSGINIGGPVSQLVVTNVAFDILLTEISSDQGKAGIGVFLGNIGLGTQAEKENRVEAVNRLQFELPITLPQQGK